MEEMKASWLSLFKARKEFTHSQLCFLVKKSYQELKERKRQTFLRSHKVNKRDWKCFRVRFPLDLTQKSEEELISLLKTLEP